MQKIGYILGTLALIFWVGVSWVYAVSVHLSASASEVHVGDTFTVTVEASSSGTNNISSTIKPKGLDAFRIIGTESQSSFQFENGHGNEVKSVRYTLTPEKTGTFSISIPVSSGTGRTRETVRIVVLPPTNAQTPTQNTPSNPSIIPNRVDTVIPSNVEEDTPTTDESTTTDESSNIWENIIQSSESLSKKFFQFSWLERIFISSITLLGVLLLGGIIVWMGFLFKKNPNKNKYFPAQTEDTLPKVSPEEHPNPASAFRAIVARRSGMDTLHATFSELASYESNPQLMALARTLAELLAQREYAPQSRVDDERIRTLLNEYRTRP